MTRKVRSQLPFETPPTLEVVPTHSRILDRLSLTTKGPPKCCTFVIEHVSHCRYTGALIRVVVNCGLLPTPGAVAEISRNIGNTSVSARLLQVAVHPLIPLRSVFVTAYVSILQFTVDVERLCS
jgi:hypothetical protein